jgi:hypothetical protein
MSILTFAANCFEKPAAHADKDMVSSRTLAKFFKLDTSEDEGNHVVAANVLRDKYGLHPNYIHQCRGCGKMFYYYDRMRALEHFGYEYRS